MMQRGFGYFQGIDIWSHLIKNKVNEISDLTIEFDALPSKQPLLKRFVSDICDTPKGRNWEGIQLILKSVSSPFVESMILQTAKDIINFDPDVASENQRLRSEISSLKSSWKKKRKKYKRLIKIVVIYTLASTVTLCSLLWF